MHTITSPSLPSIAISSPSVLMVIRPRAPVLTISPFLTIHRRNLRAISFAFSCDKRTLAVGSDEPCILTIPPIAPPTITLGSTSISICGGVSISVQPIDLGLKAKNSPVPNNSSVSSSLTLYHLTIKRFSKD